MTGPKLYPPLTTVPKGSLVRTLDGKPGEIVNVRRRKFARRYSIQLENGEIQNFRRDEFYT